MSALFLVIYTTTHNATACSLSHQFILKLKAGTWLFHGGGVGVGSDTIVMAEQETRCPSPHWFAAPLLWRKSRNRPKIGWQAWEPGANTQIPLVPRASHMAAASVSILLYWFSADCQHNLAAVGSLSELILDGNSSLTLNWVWPHGEFAWVCGFRE